MTTGTLNIFGRTISTSARTAMYFRFGVIPLLLLSATYLGYLVASVVGEYLGWGTTLTAVFLLLLTGQLDSTTNGREREISLLPKPVRAGVIGALLALTLGTLAAEGRILDFGIGLMWVLNGVIGKLVTTFWPTKPNTAVPASVSGGIWARRNSYGVEDVAFKEIA